MNKCCLDGFCVNRCDMDIRSSYTSEAIQVSSCGKIWRVKDGNLFRLSPYELRGILWVDLYNDGGQKRLAEIILRTFGEHGRGVIKYIDKDHKNCNITNLKWSLAER